MDICLLFMHFRRVLCSLLNISSLPEKTRRQKLQKNNSSSLYQDMQCDEANSARSGPPFLGIETHAHQCHAPFNLPHTRGPVTSGLINPPSSRFVEKCRSRQGLCVVTRDRMVDPLRGSSSQPGPLICSTIHLIYLFILYADLISSANRMPPPNCQAIGGGQ